MTHSIWGYIAVMALISYALRVLPLTLIRKQITNRYLSAFLYYVPYATLAVMTFPAIVDSTQTPISGIIALCLSILAAWFGWNYFSVAVLACLSVLAVEYALF